MKLQFVPLLRLQRDLYTIPRGMSRFHEYIATMVDASSGDLKLPLTAMNPMGKEHVPALLDGWIALDADDIASRAVTDAECQLGQVPGEFQVCLVIADDAKGTWTNRYFADFGHRFQSKPYHRRGWLTGILWTSDLPSGDAAREAALTTVCRKDTRWPMPAAPCRHSRPTISITHGKHWLTISIQPLGQRFSAPTAVISGPCRRIMRSGSSGAATTSVYSGFIRRHDVDQS